MPDPSERRRNFVGAVVLVLVSWITILGALPSWLPPQPRHRPIKVGILHSLTGTMAVSERLVADATLYAIEDLNQRGGVLGRKVEAVVVDGRSDWGVFATSAERLITQEKVSAVFGCWTSACRKTVKPIFERRDAVLFYPVQYEGLEQSPNIIYTGAAPNQQIIPAVKWTLDHLGRRLFLVGSDYVFPRTANKIIAAQTAALQGEVVGEAYAPLGSQDFTAIVAAIQAAQPDVIFNTINGDSNLGFFRALRAAGLTPERLPVMSFSLAESEVRALGPAMMAGDYAARNYFQSVDTPENRAFIAGIQRRFGPDTATSAPMEAAYFGVMLWARAVEEAGSAEFRDFRATIKGQSMAAPGGTVTIDPQTQHTWKTVRIGKIRPDGNFEILWDSQRPVRPVPFPSLLPRREGLAFLEALYLGWRGNWQAPPPPGP
ncbi:urea ABC transporter substrate-binding protein [Pararhodospirillum photometricum]|uniref:Substrate-binding protein of ABC transporter n=1 Tax=Pararhodospirillum photometricum DSM 122 TaxID=1150469 RepID=H6SL94_PARPM|nr:urea ABC transporter substrate-binding protein [Pararhodospirillum photometricum]CCG08759.1 Substrate-binding protein of ABC transporter [Pararhodospirillum photometricum DSM 122]